MPHSQNIQLVLDILQNEAEGDVAAAFKKMADDYSMTWMYQAKDSRSVLQPDSNSYYL